MLAPDPALFRADAATRFVGTLSLAATIVVFAMALEALRRAERDTEDDDRRVWYLGYTRDFTSTLGVVLFWFSHYLLGFPLHLAFFAGAAMALLTYVLDFVFARALALARPTVVLVAVMVLVTLPTQISPRTVSETLSRLMVVLFG